jgi:transposase InsO family protein
VGDLPDYYLDNSGNLLFQVNLPLRLKVLNNEKERNELIQNYYLNILSNAYRGSKSLYERLSREFLNISRRHVQERLKKIELVQITNPIENNKIVKPIVSERCNQQWEIDLIDISSISKNNDGITFLMCVIDTFSKFAFVEPLKNKTSQSIAYTLQNIICKEGSPEVISSDNGSEFVNSHFIELCQRFNIKHKTSLPYHPQAQGQIERFNSTIKKTIFKYLTQHNSKRYIDALQLLVYSYNTSVHNTTKRTPFEIHRKQFQSYKILDNMVFQNIQNNAIKMIENSLKNQQAQQEPLEEGDEVRIGIIFLKSGRKKIGGVNKKSLLNWTKEIYKVVDIEEKDGLELYKLDIDLKDENDRLFYRHQLLKINIQELVKTKNKNEKFDYNFGEIFDTEKHISNLAKNTALKRLLEKEQRLIDADQREEEIDKELEDEEKQRLIDADQREEEKKLLKRVRKQRDPGFFVSL